MNGRRVSVPRASPGAPVIGSLVSAAVGAGMLVDAGVLVVAAATVGLEADVVGAAATVDLGASVVGALVGAIVGPTVGAGELGWPPHAARPSVPASSSTNKR